MVDPARFEEELRRETASAPAASLPVPVEGGPGDARLFRSETLRALKPDFAAGLQRISKMSDRELNPLVDRLSGALDRLKWHEDLAIAGAEGSPGALRELASLPGFDPREAPSFGFCPVLPMSPVPFVKAAVHLAGSFDAEPYARALWGTYVGSMHQVIGAFANLMKVGRFTEGLGRLTRSDGFNPFPASGGIRGLTPYPPGPGSELFPDLDPFVGLLPDRGLPCFTEQELCLNEILYALQKLRLRGVPRPPSIGAVYPAEFCQSQTAQQTTLTPAPGTTFPPSEADSGMALVLGPQLAKIISWSTTDIVVEVPGGLAGGCHQIGWLYVPDRQLASELQGVGEQCGRFYAGAQNLGRLGNPVRFDQAELTIVGTPVIRSFKASRTQANACEAVDLSWDVDLGVCRSSTAYVHVSLRQNNADFQDYLPLSGTFPVADEATTTYTLVVVSELGVQPCGQATQNLTIMRTSRMTVTAPADACVDQNSLVNFHLEITCPAPSGGLLVQIQSNNPGRFPSASVTISAGQTSTDVGLPAGNACGIVTLTFAAAGYPSVSGDMTIVGAPQITALSRTSFSPCEPIELDITGTCLGSVADMIAAVLTDGGASSQPTALMIVVPEQKLHVSFPAQEPGSYVVVLSNCTRVSAPSAAITVTAPPPQILSFDITPSTIDFCEGPQPRLRWSVRNAGSVIIREGSRIVKGLRGADRCGITNDDSLLSSSEEAAPGPSQLVYTLEATSPWTGATVTRTTTLTRGFFSNTISRMDILNDSGRPLLLWLFAGPNGQIFGSINDGEMKTVTGGSCAFLMTAAIDPALVASHNQMFNDNLKPTDLKTAQNPRFWRWSTPMFHLRSDAPAVTATIA